MKIIFRLLMAMAFFAPSITFAKPLPQLLAALAPAARPAVLTLAVEAMHCATASGTAKPARLAVIDYSRPSTEPRLWVFDLKRHQLLHQELVAHGRNSGENYATHFSNTEGSLESSLGLYRTLDSYNGSNGYSLRMEGLDRGFNDRAFERAIVMHGAPYVDPKLAQSQGRIGRSWGCPAVRPQIAHKVIDELKGGQFVFAYYPDQQWLSQSTVLNCAVR